MRVAQINRSSGHQQFSFGARLRRHLLRRLAILPAFLLVLSCGLSSAFAGTVTFSYTGNSATPTISDSAVTATNVSAGSGVTIGISGNNLDTANWTTATSLDANDYVTFSITPTTTGYGNLDITGFSFTSDRDNSGSTGQGPTSAALRYSTNNFSSFTQSSTSPQPSGKPAQTLTAAVSVNNLPGTQSAAFRIFGWNNNSAGVTWELDDIVVTYSANSLPSLSTTLVSSPASRVMKNASNVRYQLGVTNDALAPSGGGSAQGLDYNLGLSGATGLSISPPPNGTGLARNATANHFVDVDTSTTGVKGGGNTSVTGNNAWRANGNAGQTTVTHSLGSTTVVDNRAITASAVTLGDVLVGTTTGAQSSNLSSPGSDNANTRVTVNGASASSGGVTVAAGSNVLFNGATTSSTRSVNANFATSGVKSGSINLSVSGEGLAGESVGGVAIGYSATAYDAASLTDNTGSTLDSGNNVSLANAGGSFRSAAFVGAVSASSGWTVNNLNVGNSIAAGAGTPSATVTHNDAGLLNNYVVTGTLAVALENNQSIFGSANQDLGTRNWNLSHAVSGQSGNQTAAIALSGAYDNLSGTSDKLLASVATLLDGANGNGPATTVATSWRNRLAGELPGVNPYNPLASDVVNLTGTAGDVFVLELAYNQGEAGTESMAAAMGRLYLAWLDGGVWKNAIDGNAGTNTGNPALLNYQGSWAASGAGLTLGAWGVDTSSNVVWAVLDHNSEFAAEADVVPEPSTMLLLAVGAVALLVGSRRRKLHSCG